MVRPFEKQVWQHAPCHHTLSLTLIVISLMSGRLPMHIGATNVHEGSDPDGLPRNISTLSSKLALRGYNSVMVGKWDNGFAGEWAIPKGRGFNRSLCYFSQINDYWTQTREVRECVKYGLPENINDLWKDDKPAYGLNGSAYEEVLFENAMMQAIEEHDPATPFFLYYAPHLVHDPYEVPQEWLDRFTWMTDDQPKKPRQYYSAMVAYLDAVVANITSAITAKGMMNNTLLLMMSDNGGPIYGGQGGNNYPMRGGKLDTWEGGIRVNALASGGLIPEAMRGTKSNALMALADIYATLCEVAGVDPTDEIAAAAVPPVPPIDSLSLWPLLSGQNRTGARGEYINGGVYIRADGMKLLTGKAIKDAVWTGTVYPNTSTDYDDQSNTKADCSHGCLYNVSADMGEHTDLSALPEWAAVHKAMKTRAAELARTSWGPVRRSFDPAMCTTALKNRNFWGPWTTD